MAHCQALGCKNKQGRTKKDGVKISYFTFPNPEKEKDRAERWLNNIGTGHSLETFKFSKYQTVCSEHFHKDCLEIDRVAAVLGYCPKKRFLKEGAIPTLFAHKTFDVKNMNEESISDQPPKAPKNITKEISQKETQNLNMDDRSIEEDLSDMISDVSTDSIHDTSPNNALRNVPMIQFSKHPKNVRDYAAKIRKIERKIMLGLLTDTEESKLRSSKYFSKRFEKLLNLSNKTKKSNLYKMVTNIALNQPMVDDLQKKKASPNIRRKIQTKIHNLGMREKTVQEKVTAGTLSQNDVDSFLRDMYFTIKFGEQLDLDHPISNQANPGIPTMPMCAAPGCTNITGLLNVGKKSFYQIPNPKREQTRAARWIHNMGNVKINLNNFVATKDKVICSDHFHEDCIKRDLRFELMSGKSKRKKDLVSGAVPTMFIHKTYDVINMDGTVVDIEQPASPKRTLPLEQNQVVKKLIIGDDQPSESCISQNVTDVAKPEPNNTAPVSTFEKTLTSLENVDAEIEYTANPELLLLFSTMVLCLVPGCTNNSAFNVEKKSFYQIPNPKREQTRAARWIHNMGNVKINLNNFVATKDKVVCSDHFHEDCIKRDLKFELMSGKSKKRRDLVPGAVPTIFIHKTYDVINIDGTVVDIEQPASPKRTLPLEQNQVVKKLILGEEQPSESCISQNATAATKPESNCIQPKNTAPVVEHVAPVSTFEKTSTSLENVDADIQYTLTVNHSHKK